MKTIIVKREIDESKFHPYANVFPLMQGEEYDDLVADINKNGLHEPIVMTPDGLILDGRNRWRACLDAGIENPWCETTELPESEWLAYVISLNLRRRHLNESQRAIIAARLATICHGGDRRSNQRLNSGIELTQNEAADKLNVGRDSVQKARVVLSQADPELVRLVEDGECSINVAEQVAREDHTYQQRVIEKVGSGATPIEAKRAVDKELRDANIEQISKSNVPLQTNLARRYPIVYADPPWSYENPPIGASNRSIENHYPTMTLEEICRLPVADIAADDALLYLWATAPKLRECMEVIEAWGFEYRTCFVWIKDKIGMGYHARNQHELLLVARRGDMPPPPPDVRVSSVIEAPRGEHSAKPHIVYDMIESFYPQFAKIELFARNTREGWSSYGNQVEGTKL